MTHGESRDVRQATLMLGAFPAPVHRRHGSRLHSEPFLGLGRTYAIFAETVKTARIPHCMPPAVDAGSCPARDSPRPIGRQEWVPLGGNPGYDTGA